MQQVRLSFGDVLNIWRILVAVAVCQIIGGAIGVAYGYHHFWFMNLWAGGALSIPFGVAAGAAWHFSRSRAPRESLPIAGLVVLCGALVFVAAVAIAIPEMRSDMRNLERIASLPEAGPRQVAVFGRSGEPEIMTLSDPETVAAFARSIADAVGHSPNHPRYSHSWRVIVSGSDRYVFELHLDPAFPDSVIGYTLAIGENWTSGSFRSVALRPWVEAHLLSDSAAN